MAGESVKKGRCNMRSVDPATLRLETDVYHKSCAIVYEMRIDVRPVRPNKCDS